MSSLDAERWSAVSPLLDLALDLDHVLLWDLTKLRQALREIGLDWD